MGHELDASRADFARAIGSHSRAELAARFEGKDACLSPLRRVSEVAGSELAARALRPGAKVEKLVRSPVRLAPVPFAAERSGAALLESLGLAAGEIEELIRDGVAGE